MYRVLLTRYLAETGENSDLEGIIAISTIWDSVESMNGLEHFPNKQLYSYHLSHLIRERVRMLVILYVDKLELKEFHIFLGICQKFWPNSHHYRMI